MMQPSLPISLFLGNSFGHVVVRLLRCRFRTAAFQSHIAHTAANPPRFVTGIEQSFDNSIRSNDREVSF